MGTEAERLRMPAPVPVPVALPPRPARPPSVAGSGRAGRGAAAAVCAILGAGLLGGAAAGGWLTARPPERTVAEAAYARAATVWETVPVDRLFPPAVHDATAGPGGASRDWIRLGVAPDTGCADAFDPALALALRPAGCTRLLRATYADATSSSVTTVGLLVTEADADGMRALHDRFAAERLDERPDMLPRPYAPSGTPAERFGEAQRASWRVGVLTDLPVVVWSVSAFADGRPVARPEPAARAVAPTATTAPAEAGLGHDATALAAHVERAYRAAARGGAR
ncbi:hypothetical protein H340_13082 [Streptomyces mobaraensis NBRC 13819 = DSM 40847]|uniref:Uncharacterized protein n=1 Tax=Streptomyces mobaraensis (strain ATCC 29032 / DSM 40847 / JCM 4168 / NBRC 13819 / NCIMB 11159 / IPCR 16-22) TaxID=1223523 RepID=M3A4V0_STRM1|nr:hypothetical protein [Streptomyces mobaraensis]EMF00109.1 hypothetical protein H340_13082 [Streptomyces mobaraensis NBRC 13819 = DSM 40847]